MGKNDIDAVILCGGLGTRLRTVIKNRPKVLARVGREACLDLIAGNLFSNGFKRIILATGYLEAQVRSHVEKTPLYKKGSVFFSKEKKPLGTGGAMRHALPLVQSTHFLLVNGDTLFDVPLRSFWDFHQKIGAKLSIAIFPRKREDSGGIEIDNRGRITCFSERINKEAAPFMSSGVYFMEKNAVLKNMPSKKVFSLEYDFFPDFVKTNMAFGFRSGGHFFDIGTPKRYSEALKHYIA